MRSTVGGGDKVHIKYLDHDLRGHLELLPGANVEAVSADMLLDSGAGVTALSEKVIHQLEQQWSGRELSRLYTGELGPTE